MGVMDITVGMDRCLGLGTALPRRFWASLLLLWFYSTACDTPQLTPVVAANAGFVMNW